MWISTQKGVSINTDKIVKFVATSEALISELDNGTALVIYEILSPECSLPSVVLNYINNAFRYNQGYYNVLKPKDLLYVMQSNQPTLPPSAEHCGCSTTKGPV